MKNSGHQRHLAQKYDMVAVMGGNPDAMFDLGIQELGGMGTFVQKGQKVLIKPNIGWDVIPELGSHIPILCLLKGLSNIVLKPVPKRFMYLIIHVITGLIVIIIQVLRRAAKSAGAKVVPANSESYYQQIEIPGGVKLQKAKVHQLLLETDVFINVPVLKDHEFDKNDLLSEEQYGSCMGQRLLAFE